MAPGARSKFGPPHVRNWGLSEANLLYWRKCLWHCWDFSAPPQWFGPSIVTRRPGNCATLPPFVKPLPAVCCRVRCENEGMYGTCNHSVGAVLNAWAQSTTKGMCAENSMCNQWWNSTGSQEPVLRISFVPRTGCWLTSGVLKFSQWTPFTQDLFWQTSHRPVTNFQLWKTRLKSGSTKISFERERRYKGYTDGIRCQLVLFTFPYTQTPFQL